MRNCPCRTLRVEWLEDRQAPGIVFTPSGQIVIIPVLPQRVSAIQRPPLPPPTARATPSTIVTGIRGLTSQLGGTPISTGRPVTISIQHGPPIVLPGTGSGIPIPTGQPGGIPIATGRSGGIPIPSGPAGGIPVPGGTLFQTPLPPTAFAPLPEPSVFAPAGLGLEIPQPSWTLVSPAFL